jgi:hypothetical protein
LARSQFCSGPAALNISGFTAIEMMAPARIRFWPITGSRPSDMPSAARMKENSPICARLAETVIAVFSG